VVYSRTKYPDFKDLEFSEHCHHWANSIHRFAYLSHIPEAIMVRHEELVEDPDESSAAFSGLWVFPIIPRLLSMPSTLLCIPWPTKPLPESM